MEEKPFLTYDQQLQKLIDKGLSIHDYDSAKEALKRISYYSLISGYKTLFKDTSSGMYRRNASFDEITALYLFDEELRSIFLKHILHIERKVKSLVSYYFCEVHGENQQEYLSPGNYTITRQNSRDVQRLINALTHAISLPTHYDYIEHYATNYHNVPLWVAMNAITFGQLSKLYQYLPNSIQSRISREYPHVSERQLHQFLRVLTSCRNVCAHGERLYSFRINESIPDTILHRKLNIPQVNGQYICGKSDLFSVVIALRYLLDPNEFKTVKRQLSSLIRNVLTQCPSLTEQQLYEQMGFPINWSRVTRYKK